MSGRTIVAGRLLCLTLPAGLGLVCLGTARGQGPEAASPPYRALWTRVGPAPDSGFTEGLSPIGDLTRDGTTDLAVSLAVGPQGQPGEIWYLAGRDGRTLRRIPTPYISMALAPAGDLNGDGVPDLLAYCGARQLVLGYSGADGRVLFAASSGIPGPPIHFGWAMGAIADLDNDGWREVVVASPFIFHYQGGGTQQGDLRVFSGRTRQMLHDIPPALNEIQLGRSMAIAGDLNGDGVEDIVAGAPGACRSMVTPQQCPWQDTNAGQVTAFSGATGQRLWSVQGLAREDRLGWTVAAIGDVDGDGVPDVVAGALPLDISFANPPRPGYVMVISGRTGRTLGVVRGSYPNDQFGMAVAGVGDIDGDGYPDFAVTSGGPLVGSGGGGGQVFSRVTVFSGRDLSPILVLGDNRYGSAFAYKIFGMGVVEESAFPALLVGQADGYLGNNRGAAHMVSLTPPGVDAFGKPCGDPSGPPPRIGVTGSPRVGQPLPVHIQSPAPAFTSLLLLGISDRMWGNVPLPLDLAGMGLPGCTLLVAPEAVSVAGRGPRGAATHTLTLPNDPALWGAVFFLQGVAVDTSAPAPRPAFTRALRCAVALP